MNQKPRIKIQHFGAIQQTNPDNQGWLDIEKVTVFIGDQGSGKSTVAKLISTFMWIEKALVRGDLDAKTLQRKGKFTQFLKYHRLESYVQPNSYIEYDGLAKHIIFENNQLKVQKNASHEQNYVLPQIMYVPAERNFIAYVKNARELKIASESMQEFITEFNNAKRALKEPIALPINNIHLKYQEKTDSLKLKGENYEINLSDGASGFQSAVPLLLVSEYLVKLVGNPLNNDTPMSEKERENFLIEIKNILENTDFTEEQRRLAISLISAKFIKKAFINIVEEPEQNLFPNSQWEILKRLLRANIVGEYSKLIITTHSPYIINYLSICVAVRQTYENIRKSLGIISPFRLERKLGSKLAQIVPRFAWLTSNNLSIYQLKDGIVTLLPEIYGIPSDDNYLNQMLREGNDLIDKLFDIEDEFERRLNDNI
ncbi:AAA family ATPase [Wielerella bovis]|uniref:AAA family ATPase n=1 Tax=Wielerella bovis TaxID=2917790 RepID=UPI002019A271|nr:AAA family ATPase [Wielerella bovis]ULJ64421.1 ATP-binding protein [Wielerella bovis]ULJ66700.1 ATP-binding protein [Wielerella bovis]